MWNTGIQRTSAAFSFYISSLFLFFVDFIFRQDLKSVGQEDNQKLIMLNDILAYWSTLPKAFWPAGSHAIPCGERGGAMQLTSLPGGGGAFPERKKGWTNSCKRCCLELNCGDRPHCGHDSA